MGGGSVAMVLLPSSSSESYGESDPMPPGAASTRPARALAGHRTIVAVNGLGGLEHLGDGLRAALPPAVELRVLDCLDMVTGPPSRITDARRWSRMWSSAPPIWAPFLSWAGPWVALVAARYPERVTRLVLLDPAAPHQSPFRHGPTAEPTHPYTYASVEEARQALHAFDPTVTDEVIQRGYRQNEQGRWEPRFDPAIFPALVEDAREHGAEFQAELERIRAPILFVRGERSAWRPDQQAEILTFIPDARVATIQGAGHFMIRERPESVAGLVLEFLGL